ncbi:hypothetical protein VB773_22250 [Haloarculaceae archaeon H-GB2-1]|nr:hypothetical protein [Haloarculaceae archaeon H-GB2-1]
MAFVRDDDVAAVKVLRFEGRLCVAVEGEGPDEVGSSSVSSNSAQVSPASAATSSLFRNRSPPR